MSRPSAEELVPDFVWNSLNPNEGRLSRRATFSATVALLATVMLAATIVGVAKVGLIRPELAAGDTVSSTVDSQSHTISVTTALNNIGWRKVEFTSSSSAAARLSGGASSTIPARGKITITVLYTVNCASLPSDGLSLALRVKQWWGTATDHIALLNDRLAAPVLQQVCSG